MFLGWYDDNGKKAAQTKIEEAIAAYVERFGTAPNVVLVNRRNNFWVGYEA